MDTVSLASESDAEGRLAPAELRSSAVGSAERSAVEPASREAMFGEEVERMRTFAALGAVLCAILMVVIPWVGGHPLLRWVTWAGMLFSLVSSLWMVRALKDRSRYKQHLVTVSAFLSVAIAYCGVFFVGIHSPLVMYPLIGIYYFCRSQRLRIALSIYLSCALLQGTGALFILGGWMEDPGLFRAAAVDPGVRGLAQVLVQMAFLGAFVLARASRAGTLRAMDRLIAAQKEARAREAVFQEVRQDLDRVLEVGGVGHFSAKVVGPYTLGRIIGRGAMGEVYEARDGEGRDVAVKVLHPSVLAKPSAVQRFLREASAAGSMKSPFAVRVLGASSPTDAIPHIAMERLRGQDLAQRLRTERRLPAAELAVLAQQIGSVLDEARELGIVHRDLKPQNLFWSQEGRQGGWKLLDFGASKLAEHSGTLTAGRVVGTPSYMSPEQAQGLDVDYRADLYSLAAIAYRCVTGRPPFSGKDLPTTLYQVVYATPPRPSAVARVASTLDEVLLIGMAKAPEARFSSGAELAEALRAALRGEISPEHAERARAAEREHPWGMSSRDRRSS